MTISLLTVITALGWVGAIAVVLAYGMVSKGRWTADSLAFQVANIGGAAVMLMIAVMNGIWPSALANVAAVVIGAGALRAIARARRAERAALAQVTGAAGVATVIDGADDPTAGRHAVELVPAELVAAEPGELVPAERVDLAA
ncbi:CBU_0592 family membrane protein [Isoptericola hypogeus]